MAMIKEKLKGHKPIIAAAPERGNVVNLMDALKASLGQAKPPAPSKSKARARLRRPRSRAKAASGGRGGARPRRSREAARRRERSASSARWRRCRAGSPPARSRRHGGELHRGADATDDGGGLRAHAARARATRRASRRGSRRRAAPGGSLRSENGFLRLLVGGAATEAGLAARRDAGAVRPLAGELFDLLALFDAFEHDVEPFSFRDLILARKYAGLIAGGADWARDRAVGASLRAGGLADREVAASSARAGRSTPVTGRGLSELDGQLLLGLGEPADADAEDLFAQAEAAEADGRPRRGGGALRALPRDRSRTMRWRPSTGRTACARPGARPRPRPSYARALRLDPGFVEAWFNLAGLLRGARPARTRRGGISRGRSRSTPAMPMRSSTSRRSRSRPATSPRRGAGGSATSSSIPTSEWARRAARGVQFVDAAGAGLRRLR